MKLRTIVERAEAPRTLGGFPVTVVTVDQSGVDEQASPMIKPPTNRFDSKPEAFAHAREHGGRVFRREYIDPNTGEKRISFVVKQEQGVAEGSLEEIDRRGFLKGAGAAAVAGAAGYSANKLINDPSKRWKASAHNYDELDKEYKGKSFSITSSDKKMLLVVEPSTNRVTVIVNRGPEVFNSFSNLRMKIDNNPAETIDNITGVITYFSFNYPADKILDANKISFQIAFLRRDEPGRNPMPGDYRVITFIPGQQNESANQGVAEQIQRLNHDLDEAIKLNAPQEIIPRDQLQGYADRIKTGTKTKRDKFAPIIHGSNIKAITKDDGGTEWDLDDLAKQITTRPRAILGTNAKMEKSKTEGEIIYDLTLPALSGIVVDEESGDFVEIKTCPGAGECQLFCYARKGGYVMFPASSMSAAQALNFLVNEPEGYMAAVNKEITALKSKTDKAGIQLVVRWHDAGDFFSKEYLDLAYDVANANPDVKFYAYTKMGDVATGSHPPNFIINFSSGSKSREVKKVELHRQAGNTVKQGVTVPKNMFFDLIARKGNSLIKDAKGRTQFASPEALDTFKDRLAQQYRVPRDTIITYDQMLATPEGPKPKWNVIVQPGAGDRAANRLDVIDSYLMFH
jgi:hypothetical protein